MDGGKGQVFLVLAREAQRDNTPLASGVGEGAEGARAANEQRGFREIVMGSEARDARRVLRRDSIYIYIYISLSLSYFCRLGGEGE